MQPTAHLAFRDRKGGSEIGWRYERCEECKGSGLVVKWSADLSDFDLVPCSCDGGLVRVRLRGGQ
jgi:hypothetical protein